MNTITDQPPPPPPLQPPRSSFSCDRHPVENFTGFCPSCLCERLTILDQSAAAASSSSRRNSTSSSTAAAAIKSIFRPSEANRNKSTTRTSFLPELRRTKSFSASKNEGLGFFTGGYEPQRKSCDVRGRSTLWSLFSIADENNPGHASLGTTGAVLETNKEEEDDEIRVSEEQDVRNSNDLEHDIAEMEAEVDAIVDNLKTVKDHIDLDAPSKKPSLSNLWSAASVLSKKWQKWRRKQKKSPTAGNTFPAEKPTSRHCRETQSEIADYGLGRRSCDIDPRFSLDAGRVSFDDPRFSLDEPRASWDGYSIGRTFPRPPPMAAPVPRSDMQIPVEEEPDDIPGGSTQTREYYLDSSSKRRKSLDRSNSIRITDDRNPNTLVSNAKVSPATIDYNHRFKFGPDSNSNSIRENSFDNGSKKARWWNWKPWSHGGAGHKDPRRENLNGFNSKVCRSNSSISHRREPMDRFVLERNRSARSGQVTNGLNNGLLRFDLMPLRGSRREPIGIGLGKSRLSSNSQSIARNMVRFY